jgi:hypothetical protein
MCQLRKEKLVFVGLDGCGLQVVGVPGDVVNSKFTEVEATLRLSTAIH